MRGKASAAILLGLPLAVGLVSLAVMFWPGTPKAHALVPLTLFFPVWIGTMSSAFACRTGARAWLWLGLATAACVVAVLACRALGLAELSA